METCDILEKMNFPTEYNYNKTREVRVICISTSKMEQHTPSLSVEKNISSIKEDICQNTISTKVFTLIPNFYPEIQIKQNVRDAVFWIFESGNIKADEKISRISSWDILKKREKATAYLFYFYLYNYLVFIECDKSKRKDTNYFQSNMFEAIEKLNNHQNGNFSLLLLMIYRKIYAKQEQTKIRKYLNNAINNNLIIAHLYVYYKQNSSTHISGKDDARKKSCMKLLELNYINILENPRYTVFDEMKYICHNFKIYNGMNTDNMTMLEYIYYILQIDSNNADKLFEIVSGHLHKHAAHIIPEKHNELLYKIETIYILKEKPKYKYYTFGSDKKKCIANVENGAKERILILNVCMRKNRKRDLPEELYNYIHEDFIMKSSMKRINLLYKEIP